MDMLLLGGGTGGGGDGGACSVLLPLFMVMAQAQHLNDSVCLSTATPPPSTTTGLGSSFLLQQ